MPSKLLKFTAKHGHKNLTYSQRRYLNKTTAYIQDLHPHCTETDVIDHALFQNAIGMDLSPHMVVRGERSFIRNVKGTIEFKSPHDKDEAVRLSRKYLGKSLVRTVSNPKIHLQRIDKQHSMLEWASLHSHAPGDRVNIENVHPDTTEADFRETLRRLRLKGFVQAHIFKNDDEYSDLRKAAGFRKSDIERFNFSSFAVIYFENAKKAGQFQETARTKKIKIRGNEIAVHWKCPADIRTAVTGEIDEQRIPLQFLRKNNEDFLGSESISFDTVADSPADEFTEKAKEFNTFHGTDVDASEGELVSEAETFTFDEKSEQIQQKEVSSIKI